MLLAECDSLLLGVEQQGRAAHVLKGVRSGGPAHQGVDPPAGTSQGQGRGAARDRRLQLRGAQSGMESAGSG